jgi:hypothetical protein
LKLRRVLSDDQKSRLNHRDFVAKATIVEVTQQHPLLGAFLFMVPSIILSRFATPTAADMSTAGAEGRHAPREAAATKLAKFMPQSAPHGFLSSSFEYVTRPQGA